MNNEQLMKFKITNNKLKMEISIKDLVWLFHNSPNNFISAKVRPGRQNEFVEFIVNRLKGFSSHDENNTLWGQPFEEIFEGLCAEDEIIKYYESDFDEKGGA